MSNIHIVLVIDDSTDESGVQVVDLTRVQPLTQNFFLIETKPFRDICLANGAGPQIDSLQALTIVKNLINKYDLHI